MEIIQRQDAVACGLVHYCTGKSCKRGHFSNRYVSGRQCVECHRLHMISNVDKQKAASKRWADDNKERVLERSRRYRRKHSGESQWLQRRTKTQRSWLRATREKRIEKRKADARKYYGQNKLKCLERTKRHRLKNLKRYATYKRNRDARKRDASGSHTLGDIAEINRLQRGRCGYCREKLRKSATHVDHINSLSKGGSNDKTNLQLLCAECNVRKSDRDPIVFARLLGNLI